jgi:hypothetical protein
MNSLRLPVTLLVIVVVGFFVWFWLARPISVHAPAQTSTTTVSTTSNSSGQASSPQTTPSPTLDPSSVAQNIVGSWQSTDDANYSVAITSAGKWTDSYKGSNASSSVSETGTYELFTSADPDKDFTGTLVPGVVYVKVSEGTSVLYFSVLDASASNLQLSYLDRGNTLSFVKVQ